MLQKDFSVAVLCLIALPLGFGMIGQTERVSAANDTQDDARALRKYVSPRDESNLRVPAPPAPPSGVWATSPPSINLDSANPGPYRFFGLTSAERGQDKKVNDAARALRQAKSDQDRDAAMENLSTLLVEDYEQRLDGYEEYLDQLDQQLAEMRAKLKKRRQAKSEMVELRIKVLEAEAEDLGWPKRVTPKFPARLQTPRYVPRDNQ